MGRQYMRSFGSGPLLQMSKPMMFASMRAFGHTKYSFDDEDWEPNQYQVSVQQYRTFYQERELTLFDLLNRINDAKLVTFVHASYSFPP